MKRMDRRTKRMGKRKKRIGTVVASGKNLSKSSKSF